MVNLFNNLGIAVRDKGYLRNALVMRLGDVETVNIKAAPAEKSCHTCEYSKSIFDQNGKNVSFFWIHFFIVFSAGCYATLSVIGFQLRGLRGTIHSLAGYRLSVVDFQLRGFRLTKEIRRNVQAKHLL